MSSLAVYQPYLAECDPTSPRQSYRIDCIDPYGWCVKVHGRYIGEFATRIEAQRWLAGFLLAASTVEDATI